MLLGQIDKSNQTDYYHLFAILASEQNRFFFFSLTLFISKCISMAGMIFPWFFDQLAVIVIALYLLMNTKNPPDDVW